MDVGKGKCFICYESGNVKEKSSSSAVEGTNSEEDVIRKQLQVIFLLKKLFSVPEKICCLFLQKYGNPSSWIYWCDSCSVLVDEAKRYFDDITKLERNIERVKQDIETKIHSSGENKNFGQPNRVKDKDKPTEVVRNMIMQGTGAFKNGVNFPEVIEVKMENRFEKNSLDFSYDNESLDDFSFGDIETIEELDEETINSVIETKDKNISSDKVVAKLKKNSVINEHYNTRASQMRAKVTRGTGNVKNTIKADINLKECVHQCSLCLVKFTRKEKLKSHLLSHPPPCPFCEEQLLRQDEFKSHVKIHESEEMKRTSCVICNGEFTEFIDILNHKCNPLDESEDSDDSSINAQNSKPNQKRMSGKSRSSDNTSLECSYCGKTFKTNKNLKLHLLIHTDPENRPFHCSTCGKSFRFKNNMLDHEKIHAGTNIVQCSVCNKTLSTSSLGHHMRIHKKENEKFYKCETCEDSFPTYSNLREHKKLHRGEMPYACRFCDKKFKRKTDFTDHERIHTGEQPFSCPTCEIRFSNRKSFKNHLRIHSEEPPPHPCSYCEKRFYITRDLERHERIHTGEKPHPCSICNKSFAMSKSLTDHMKIHIGEQQGRPYLCTICGASFSVAKYLKKHELVHSGEKRFACQFCPSTFGTKSTLTTHERSHTGEKPYGCSVCEMTFRFNKTLRVHMRKHTGVPAPHQCSFCEKSFESKSQKIAHERVHTKEKPFPCTICGKFFVTPVGILKHVRIVHEKVPGKFSCDVCGKRFHKKYHLDQHGNKRHGSSGQIRL